MDRLLTRNGFSIHREPTCFSDKLRPDGVVQASTPLMYDITYTDSTLTAQQRTVTQNLQAHAVAKHHKYDHLAATNGSQFFPLAMDVYGHVHSEFDLFVTTLSKELKPDKRTPFRRSVFCMIQQATAVGNARIIMQYHRRLSGVDSSAWAPRL